MKNIKTTPKTIFVLSLILLAALIMPATSFANQLPETKQPMISCLKGNLTYYVKPGDKVKTGDPLFLVVTADNNSAIFFQIVHKIKYYTKIYNRRMELIKTHAVSKEELGNTLNDLVLSKDELVSYLCKFKEGFYAAPYECKIVSVEFPNGSGIKDGFAALYISPLDENGAIETRKANDKLMAILKATNELTNEEVDNLNVETIISILQKAK